MFDGVSGHEMQGLRIPGPEGPCQVGAGAGSFFDGPDVRPGPEERLGQGPEPGSDFHDGVARADPGELERFADDVSVDQEVLAQAALRTAPELREQRRVAVGESGMPGN